MENYFINSEKVSAAIFQESLNESIEGLNEYELNEISNHFEYHNNVAIQINGIQYAIQNME